MPDNSAIGRGLVTLALAGAVLAPGFPAAFAANDLSGHTELRDYGRDMLAQALPANASLVGILGEMTLVRYVQAAEQLQPALRTLAADRDGERLAAINGEVAAGRAVFTTRLLNGLPETYALGAAGPLVQVFAQSRPGTLPADAPRVGDIKYELTGTEQHGESVGYLADSASRFLRVNIAWEPSAPISADLKISARLLYGGSQLTAQRDDWPVHNAYHTNFWRPGERIADVYDIPLSGVTVRAPETFQLLLIVYRAETGAEIGRIDGGEVTLR